jgi:hypothetical protein
LGGAAAAHAVVVGRPRRAGGAASVERVAAIAAGRDAAALITTPSTGFGFASPAPKDNGSQAYKSRTVIVV